jgi:PAS domain S-box-containing protein
MEGTPACRHLAVCAPRPRTGYLVVVRTTDAGGRPAGGRRRSLRWRVARLATAGVLLLVAQLASQLVAGTAAEMSGLEANRQATTLLVVTNLRVSVDEQRAALFAYLQTGLPQFADTYSARRSATNGQMGQLRRDLAGRPEGARLGSLRTDVDAWQAWADTMRTRPPGPAAISGAGVLEGQRLFDHFSASQAALSTAVSAAADAAGWAAERAGLVAFVTSMTGSVGVGVVLVVLVVRIIKLGVAPVLRLAATAGRIARGEPATIDVAGTDEVGGLARALAAWQDAAAVRELVAQQAPMGIIRIDLDGRVVSVNRATELIHGAEVGGMVGRPLHDFVHPADHRIADEAMQGLQDGHISSATIEARALRPDSSTVWCAVTVGRLLDSAGLPVGTVGVVEDIGERKRQEERATRVQRDLWPRTPPVLPGYEVAGACRPAQEVSGDLYDWMLTSDGHLELTLADVMGKGIGAALVMATLRSALRSAPVGLGPAGKLALAATSMPLGMDEDGTFVTVFHGLLDPRSGDLRYVDAGHGYCLVRRAGGDLLPLGTRSLPLGVAPDDAFLEGRVRLAPGDTLVVYSDGLVETGDPSLDERSFGDDLAEAADAEDVVRRLLGRLPAHLADDATALVLRRVVESREAAAPRAAAVAAT